MNKIIGLEIHIELATESKMFCSCPADHFGKKPNSQTCPICLGLPGALPFANQAAVEKIIKLGLALECEINTFSKFDRKHYFYPDLPKGYQISQYDLPFCQNGKFTVPGTKKDIRIKRVHLEEDTGKLVHAKVEGREVSLVDFNRSGVALVEIVTEPDFKSIETVIVFLKEIQLLVRYLGISDADMEKGSMRLEANLSLSDSQKLPDYKVELKNINSFRFLEKALQIEFKRQAKLLKMGKKVVQETRGYNEKTDKTFSQRSKEEEEDYRYFPEPDIPPVVITQEEINKLKTQIPELAPAKRRKFEKKYKLSGHFVQILTQDLARAEFFEEAVKLAADQIPTKKIADVMINQKLDEEFETPAKLVKKLLLVNRRETASEDLVKATVEKVLQENSQAVEDFKSGKTQALGFLIGQVQRTLKGRGVPQEIKKALLSRLEK